MSVVPKEDNLVMSFKEATRVFNHNQSNTGDNSNQLPNAINSQVEDVDEGGEPQPSRSYYRSEYNDNNGSNSNDGLRLNTISNIYSNPNTLKYYSDLNDEYVKKQQQQQQEPLSSRKRTASVLPAAFPSQDHIRNNPNKKVEIRNPSNQSVPGDNLNDDGINGNRETDRNLFRAVDESGQESDEFIYTNYWFTFRRYTREYFAEFLGTLILVTWGEGTQAQVVAARKETSDYLSIAVGWGVGFMFAIYVSSGISGGHVNPAVTISLAVFRGFSWKKVPGFILAQTLGGFVGCSIIYGVYYVPLHTLGNSAHAAILTTGPDALGEKLSTIFFSVFTGAALLMGAISAFTDTGNNPATPGLTPLLLGVVMVGLASSFGYQTGFVLNPARDLGPRLFVYSTGFDGKTLWLADSAYGIWIPAVCTITGALFGNLAYDLLIYNGRNSPINFNFSRRNRRNIRARQNQTIDNDDSSNEYAKGISNGEKGYTSATKPLSGTVSRETRIGGRESTLVGSPVFSNSSGTEF